MKGIDFFSGKFLNLIKKEPEKKMKDNVSTKSLKWNYYGEAVKHQLAYLIKVACLELIYSTWWRNVFLVDTKVANYRIFGHKIRYQDKLKKIRQRMSRKTSTKDTPEPKTP